MTISKYYTTFTKELIDQIKEMSKRYDENEKNLEGKLIKVQDLINEINYDVLNNSKYYFQLKINNQQYAYYLFSGNLENIENISIEFVGPFPLYCIKKLYIPYNDIDKKVILRWMLDTIFKENLSC